MAIYDAGTASLAADGTVTGVGTTWRQPLTLIRVGATMIFNTTPASIVTIAEIISDTEIRVFNDKGFTAPTGTQYSILAHDGITVQGLAQDVAETLRYYQSRETEVAAAVDAFNQFDANAFQQNVTNVNNQSQQVAADAAQVSSDKAQVSSDKYSAAASAASALADKNAAAASAAEAADSAASLNTSNLLRVDRSLSDLTDKALSRANLDVYSKAEVDSSKFVVHVRDFGAVGDNSTDATPGVNAALAVLRSSGGGILQFDAGTYLFSSYIDLRGIKVCMRGVGQYTTTLKANYSGDVFVQMFEDADSRISPLTISDMYIDGDRKVQNVMQLRYRHYVKFENIIFTGGTANAVYMVDSWLTSFFNCGFESSNYGLFLAGANHRNAFYSCSFQGNDNINLAVRSNGTAPDGNTALYFANCDFEFSTGSGIDFAGTDATFDGCYIGENLGGASFIVRSGNVRVNGGVMYFGFSQNTFMASMDGGNIIFDGSIVNGQEFGSVSTLVFGNGGKAAFKGCQLNFPLGGTPVMVGDSLLALNDKEVFAPRLGIDYTGYGLRATISETVSGASKTLSVQSVQGPEPIIVGLRAPLISNKWIPGQVWAMVVTYASNVDFVAAVAVSELGENTVIGSLPASGGGVRTAVLYTTSALRNNDSFIEIFRNDVLSAGHYFTLHSVSFGDSRAAGIEFGSGAGNIYKF